MKRFGSGTFGVVGAVILAGLAVLLVPATAQAQDSDNNDNSGSATVITLDGGKATGSVRKVVDNGDMFAITTTTAGYFSVFLTWTNAADYLELALIDTDGITELDLNATALRRFQEVDGQLSAGQTYYFRVAARNTPAGVANYTVWTVFSSLASVDDHPADADKNSTTHEILNGEILSNTVSAAGDQDDWYYFELIAAGTEQVTLSWTDTNANLDLHIFEADGTTLLASGTNTAGTSEVVSFNYPLGRFYARVRAISGSNVAFDIALNSPTNGGGSTGASKCGTIPGSDAPAYAHLLALLLLGLWIARRRPH